MASIERLHCGHRWWCWRRATYVLRDNGQVVLARCDKHLTVADEARMAMGEG